MSDFWMIGLSGAALYLRANGFSWSESDRLLRLKLRHERGEFRELTDENKRLEFAHWHLRNLSDHAAVRPAGRSRRVRLPAGFRAGPGV